MTSTIDIVQLDEKDLAFIEAVIKEIDLPSKEELDPTSYVAK